MERTRTVLVGPAWIALAVVAAGCHPVARGVGGSSGAPEQLEASAEASAEADWVFEQRHHQGPWPQPQAWKPKQCPAIFDQDAVQVFEIEIDPGVWQELVYEFENYSQLYKDGVDLETYRPLIRFTHGGKSTTDAMIRLRGNTKFWDRQDKMQFQISFNERNPEGRFRGLRKIVLDSAYYNPTYLHDRLATAIAHQAGVISSCVNHARLHVNGVFYGLYANIEKVDREFLERNFEEPGANLYKMSRLQPGELKTNEDENPDTSRFDTFWAADQLDELQTMANLPQMVRAWALEAVFPNADGYWAGGWNFYLYDEPGKGFAYLLWDQDRAFDEPYDVDPLTWHKTNENFNGRPHVELVLGDPTWRREFIRQVRHVRDAMDANELQSQLDEWAAQIRDSAREDPHAPWSFADHESAVLRLREKLGRRLQFLDGWLACWESHEGDENFHGPCPQ